MDGLTEEKLGEFLQLFKLYDKEGDGAIRTQDLGQVLRACGLHASEAEINTMMRQVDPSNIGTINFPSFLDCLSAFTQRSSDLEDILDAFRCFDKSNSGYIDARELKQVLLSMGERLSEQEAEELVREADKDRTGQIYYYNFAKIMSGQA